MSVTLCGVGRSLRWARWRWHRVRITRGKEKERNETSEENEYKLPRAVKKAIDKFIDAVFFESREKAEELYPVSLCFRHITQFAAFSSFTARSQIH